MKKVLRPICYFLYYLIAKHLPESHSIFSLGISGKIRTLLTRGIIDSCGKSVDIEKNAKFSPHMIFQGFEEAKKVIIKDDVWIGSNVIILPGVTIESGAIIGAGSVVTKDVLKNTIVAGNPAKVIKERK